MYMYMYMFVYICVYIYMHTLVPYKSFLVISTGHQIQFEQKPRFVISKPVVQTKRAHKWLV